MRRQPRPHEGCNVGGQRRAGLVARSQHDKRLDDFCPQRVRLADNRRHGDGRVAGKAVFDLARADAVTR